MRECTKEEVKNGSEKRGSEIEFSYGTNSKTKLDNPVEQSLMWKNMTKQHRTQEKQRQKPKHNVPMLKSKKIKKLSKGNKIKNKY